MQCPTCNVTLMMTERQGIEIDYCPQCRGVWLDRGELDKIIERATQESVAAQPAARPTPPEAYRGDFYSGDKYHGKHKKKKSLLGELFDF
jgi:Zn-finger nucleic acid-binding protein